MLLLTNMSWDNEKLENLYNILNVSDKASQSEIKQSFRKLSLQYHPDKDKKTTEYYKKILNAYEILNDINKKTLYDLQYFKYSKENRSNVLDIKSNQKEIIQDKEYRYKKDIIFPDLIYKRLELSLEQSYLGCIIPIEIEKKIEYNNKISTEIETIYITIPQGIDNNEIILIKNKGNSINHIINGDIKIQINILENEIFKRNGLDLIYFKNITLKESLCGFSFNIHHINRKIYTIKNDGSSIIKDGQQQIISKLGIKRENYIGNLIIKFKIDYPEKLSLEQRKILQQTL